MSARMFIPVSVITPTIPDRRIALAQAMASVDQQTLVPEAHLIAVDNAFAGPACLRSGLVRAAGTDWVAFLDDDDLLDTNHLQVLYDVAEAHGADLVYSWCRFDGPPLPAQYFNNPWDREKLREHGIFPITVLARRSAVLDFGAFNENDTYEDWSLWNRMADGGCQFICVPSETWTYRTGHQGRTTQAMAGLR